MFGKKKNNATIYDIKIKELGQSLHNASTRLRGATERSITVNAVVDLYPIGADKERAKTDAEKAKYSLLCAIGEYDSLLNEYNAALAKNKEDRNITVNWAQVHTTSHQLIEIAYRNYYNRG